ncbi:WD40 domain-containing protein [Streptomyces sp. N2-109]|uniref:WD40 domain-containing protein n=1 Tax=Streptomyces gossypii TaxID=2883101 RepID=A0ABT2JT57_9ACTN|nr:WD40 domain-containing protein [Streptomyces gossypii]
MGIGVVVHEHGHTDPVSSVAFSPDGKTLATSSADYDVLLWDPALPDVAEASKRMCRAVGRPFSRQERSDYLRGQTTKLVCPEPAGR